MIVPKVSVAIGFEIATAERMHTDRVRNVGELTRIHHSA